MATPTSEIHGHKSLVSFLKKQMLKGFTPICRMERRPSFSPPAGSTAMKYFVSVQVKTTPHRNEQCEDVETIHKEEAICKICFKNIDEERIREETEKRGYDHKVIVKTKCNCKFTTLAHEDCVIDKSEKRGGKINCGECGQVITEYRPVILLIEQAECVFCFHKFGKNETVLRIKCKCRPRITHEKCASGRKTCYCCNQEMQCVPIMTSSKTDKKTKFSGSKAINKQKLERGSKSEGFWRSCSSCFK